MITFLSTLYPRIERRSRERACSSRQIRFFLQSAEQSAFFSSGERLLRFLGSLSLSAYGRMGVFYGVFSSVILLTRQKFSLPATMVSLGIAIASIPILHVEKSLYTELEDSRLLGGFLFDFCGFLCHEEQRKVKRCAWFPLFVAFFAAVLGIYLPSRILFGMLAGGILLYLLFLIPELGVCAVFLGLPFFQQLSSPTLFLILLSLLTCLAWLKKVLLGKRVASFDFLDRLVLLLVVLYALSGVVGAGGASSAWEGLSRAALLGFWFPVRGLLENERWQRRATFSLCLSASFCALLGIFQYFFAERELLWVDASRFSSLGSRVCATYSNPNFLALFLVLSLPFFLGIIFNKCHRAWIRSLAMLGFSAVCLCLILTWTRGAWLGAAGEVAVFLLLCGKESLAVFLMLPIPVAAVLRFLPYPVRLRFLSIGSLGESSIRYRLYTWRGVLRMLSAHPFGIGVGETAFQAIYPIYAVSGTERVMHAHRLDLQVLTEHGVIGFCVFLLFFLLILLRVLYALKCAKGQARIGILSAFCAILGATVMGCFDYIWYHFGNFTLFFMIAAWCCVRFSKEGEEEYHVKA